MSIVEVEKEFGYRLLKKQTYSAVGQEEIKAAYKNILEAKAKLKNAYDDITAKPYTGGDTEKKSEREELLSYVKKEILELEAAAAKKIY